MFLSYKKELLKKISSVRQVIVKKGRFIYPVLVVVAIVLFFGLKTAVEKGSFFYIAPSKIKVSTTLVPTVTLTSTFTDISTPTPIPYLTASGEYFDQNKKVSIQIKFPKYGGSITGVVIGACNSSELNGQYNSNNNEISGVVTGKCDNLSKFQNSVAKAAFKGKVDMSNQKIDIDFDGGIYPNAPYDNTSLHIPYNGKHVSLFIKG